MARLNSKSKTREVRFPHEMITDIDYCRGDLSFSDFVRMACARLIAEKVIKPSDDIDFSDIDFSDIDETTTDSDLAAFKQSQKSDLELHLEAKSQKEKSQKNAELLVNNEIHDLMVEKYGTELIEKAENMGVDAPTLQEMNVPADELAQLLNRM